MQMWAYQLLKALQGIGSNKHAACQPFVVALKPYRLSDVPKTISVYHLELVAFFVA